MSKLRQAAQALCDRWDTPLWKDVAPTAVFIGELRAAIAREKAQTVEPVAWMTKASGDLHSVRSHEKFDAGDIPLFTHPAPTATAPVKLPENCGTGHCSCIECVKPAKPSAGEREALIHWLRERSMWDGMLRLGDAADMLAADAQWKELRDPAILHANLLRGLPAQLSKEQLLHLLGTDAPAELAQQVAVPQGWKLVPIEPTSEMLQAAYGGRWQGSTECMCLNMVEAAPQPPQADHPEVELSDGEIYSRMSKAIDARLNIRVPMTKQQVIGAFGEFCIDAIGTDNAMHVAEVIQKFHGIGVKP